MENDNSIPFDDLIRKKLRVSHPTDPDEVAGALSALYDLDSSFIELTANLIAAAINNENALRSLITFIEEKG